MNLKTEIHSVCDLFFISLFPGSEYKRLRNTKNRLYTLAKIIINGLAFLFKKGGHMWQWQTRVSRKTVIFLINRISMIE